MASPERPPSPPAWWAAPMLTLAIAVLIGLIGPLLLFNPWYASFEQARNDVPARLGTTQDNVDRVTGQILCDLLFGCDDFAETLGSSTPLLTDDERGHMRDVSSLIRTLWLLVALAIVAAALSARSLRSRYRVGRQLVVAATIVGGLAIVVGLIFATAFDQAFLFFHEVFFPQGNFLFAPDSNLLRLFPDGLWFDGSLTAGGSIVLTALLVALVGRRLTRTTDPDSRGGQGA